MTDKVFVDGLNVLLCEPGDAATITDKIEARMDNEQLREKLHSGVKKLAQEWLTWDMGIVQTLATLGSPY